MTSLGRTATSHHSLPLRLSVPSLKSSVPRLGLWSLKAANCAHSPGCLGVLPARGSTCSIRSRRGSDTSNGLRTASPSPPSIFNVFIIFHLRVLCVCLFVYMCATCVRVLKEAGDQLQVSFQTAQGSSSLYPSELGLQACPSTPDFSASPGDPTKV